MHENTLNTGILYNVVSAIPGVILTETVQVKIIRWHR